MMEMIGPVLESMFMLLVVAHAAVVHKQLRNLIAWNEQLQRRIELLESEPVILPFPGKPEDGELRSYD